ncbi:Metallo-hydrolase/oxidoreductase [Mollisia scopiformis]|uniref:Metallo-hydrolase/oxidoreductase n=1 Tax=Mollisia scopiformis TaxID=149040 RepID=A0A194WU63_MOLSC|nr:Metallo-hydrolase/oxidoreductase [Mollisia scopiformis]KUJ11214.1 Metallo-hydrolase/oxidoreductase [Mollisia scopiformis]
MSNVFIKQTAPPSPPLEAIPATVQLHVLSAGHLTLPERHFVHPASEEARSTVPSLAFLIQHENIETGRKTRIVFDLGLRRDLERYSEPIQQHAATRQPISTDPDVVKSLKAGGLTPDDIDFVIYSHVHWDHVGEPRDFSQSKFVVGNGATDLLQGTSTSLRGGHSFFESDLIPHDRTIELSSPTASKFSNINEPLSQKPGVPNFHQQWKSHLHLPHVIDLFQDGSLYIVDAPGHLPGHINLLARTGINESVYLAGDACHDRRILRKEKTIGTWADAEGYTCCIHANREKAEETIDRIRELERQGIEVIFAHDVEWEQDPKNRDRQHPYAQNLPPLHDSLLSTMATPKPSQEEQKQKFISTLGATSWNSSWASVSSLSPEIFAASIHLSSIPLKKQHLHPKIQSLISLTVSASSTHLYTPGIHRHTKAALENGASPAEIMEVLELTSTLGIHACNIGVPLLMEVMKEEGLYEGKFGAASGWEEGSERKRLREEFTAKRGYWHEFWEDFLKLDPEFFAAYLDFSTVPWVRDARDGKAGGVLEPKVKELVYCAFDAASTHLYQPGLKLHMRNALGLGASPEEIMEVLELATLLSLHTLEVATPILVEHMKK